jgi:hypothetical protein
MIMRWLSCGTESLHIVGACPDCYASQTGLLLGTVATAYVGRVTARCIECGRSMDYFVDSNAENIWKMELVASKGIRGEQ